MGEAGTTSGVDRAWRLASVLAGLCAGLVLLPLPVRAADPVVEGFRHLEAGRPAKALALFERALSRHPGAPELLTYIGLGHFKSGHYAEALEAFEQARSRDSDIIDSAFLFYRASALRALGLTAMEREAWGEVITYDPESRFASRAREAREATDEEIGRASREFVENGFLHWGERPMVAAACFREALARDPGAARVPTYLAAVLNQAGHYREAAELRQRYGAPRGHAAAWEMQMGVAQMGLREWEQAARVLRRVPAASAWIHKAQYLRAVCLVRLGREQQAASLLQHLPPEEIPEMEDEWRVLLDALGLKKAPAAKPP